MQSKFKFEKILTIKEREKNEAFDVYNQSIKRFEEAAGKLYDLLKKKEELESQQALKLASGMPVQEIRYHQQFLSNIEKTINHYQKVVINARNHMNYQHERLIDKNIEVKKFEKMKEKAVIYAIDNERQIEGKQMDDISIQQFMNRGN